MRSLSPFTVQNGTNVIQPSGDFSLVRTVVIANISPYALLVTGVDAEQILPPMGVNRFDCADGLAQLNLIATQIFASSGFPANSCLVTFFMSGDPDPGPGYPYSLGSGSVNLTAPTQIISDGYTPGTVVVEATPSGQNTSFLRMTNDGQMQWFVMSNGSPIATMIIAAGNPASIEFLGVATSANQSVSTVDSLTNPQVQYQPTYNPGQPGVLLQPFHGVSSNACGWLFAITKPAGAGIGSALALNPDQTVETFGQLQVTSGGAAITGNSQVTGTLGVSGLLTASLGVALTTGQITRVSRFTGSGNGTYTHNLGTTPDIVLVMPNNTTPQAYSCNSLTSTTVAVDITGSFTAVAIKF